MSSTTTDEDIRPAPDIFRQRSYITSKYPFFYPSISAAAIMPALLSFSI